MSKSLKIVRWLAVIAILSAVVATPVLAKDPDAPVTVWQRLRQWFCWGEESAAPAAGARLLMRWQNGADGEAFGPRLGSGAWNETGAAKQIGQESLDVAALSVDSASAGAGAAKGYGEPCLGDTCLCLDEDGDGVCGPPAGAGDGVCEDDCNNLQNQNNGPQGNGATDTGGQGGSGSAGGANDGGQNGGGNGGQGGNGGGNGGGGGR